MIQQVVEHHVINWFDHMVIEARFARYGPYAGLAFWLFITRDWVADTPATGTTEDER